MKVVNCAPRYSLALSACALAAPLRLFFSSVVACLCLCQCLWSCLSLPFALFLSLSARSTPTSNSGCQRDNNNFVLRAQTLYGRSLFATGFTVRVLRVLDLQTRHTRTGMYCVVSMSGLDAAETALHQATASPQVRPWRGAAWHASSFPQRANPLLRGKVKFTLKNIV